MKNLTFAAGIAEYSINGHATLRFNPNDTDIYKRFMELLSEIEDAGEKIQKASEQLKDESNPDRWGMPASARAMLTLISDLDKRVKDRLQYVFGSENDFDDIFEGVSAFALTETGEWVITNFLNAIRPEIESYAKTTVESKAREAKLNRQQRRAAATK